MKICYRKVILMVGKIMESFREVQPYNAYEVLRTYRVI